MDINFGFKDLTCCSLELFWSYHSEKKNEIESYELFQKEIEDGFFKFNKFTSIYKGKNTSYEVIDLAPKKNYTFKIKVTLKDSTEEDKTIEIRTLNAPHAFLSENSISIANFGFAQNKNILNDFSERIFKIVVNLFLKKITKIY